MVTAPCVRGVEMAQGNYMHLASGMYIPEGSVLCRILFYLLGVAGFLALMSYIYIEICK